MAGDDPSLRLVFMGTAAFAVPSLETLAASRHRVVAVYTQPARRAGRGMRPRPSPVHQMAERLELPVHTPASLRNDAGQPALADLDADLGVVVAFGLILPQTVLDAPRLGCINVHASLLPRWRGAAPIQRALLAGDRETGISIIQMEPSLDTGPILATERLPITPETTAQDLLIALAAVGARVLIPTIDAVASGSVRPVPQPQEGVTYAHKVDRDEGRLDWSRPAAALERQLRALNPRPGCWTELRGQRLLVLAGEVVNASGPPGEVLDERLTVACGSAALRMTKLQRAGGRPLGAADFLRGVAVPIGTRLGPSCPATS